MAYEKRHNKTYYYRKTRVGDRVSSHYVGSAPWIEGLLDGRNRQRREERQLRQDLATLGTELAQLYTLIHTLRQTTLLLTGHHTHKGQWRQKRPHSP